MKKFLRILSLLFTFALCGYAQTPTTATSAKPKIESVTWTTHDCKICDSILIEGQKFYIINDENVYIAIYPGFGDDYLLADVYIVNKGENRFEFDPNSDTGILVWDTADKYMANKFPDDVLSSVSPEKVVKKMKKRVGWSNFFTGLAATLQSQTATVTSTERGTVNIYNSNGTSESGIYSSTSTATVETPNIQAQQQAQKRIAENNATVASKSNAVQERALRANTIFQNNSVFGTVYYPKKKKYDVLKINFRVGDKIYSFLFNLKNSNK